MATYESCDGIPPPSRAPFPALGGETFFGVFLMNQRLTHKRSGTTSSPTLLAGAPNTQEATSGPSPMPWAGPSF
jgi:hypothetical protein